MTDIAQVLGEVSTAADPVDVLRAAVLSQDGFWPSQQVGVGIYEVQLFGVVGIGPSQAGAVDDWVVQANAYARTAA
ncbi:hypothetical protein XMV201_002388 [Aliiroseovarius sp. xm-v-201]|uniref:hypothetical protein n=1 Tax=unclassified Aliiroseovarius TaxID=2623558 RepID=UPI00156A0926|nr:MULTISPECIES: hypothetical protein [unclassified Aliiroseovarius]NRP50618.1 hypothetical protein [Aliiroseovarius sp. xm-m-354]NRQ05370.1 hypothetical protein [Aliiroseovarius sp. xm-m-309]NRQ08575.1 hypothetical protein [Aliiroseovarius sp. xm-v-201]